MYKRGNDWYSDFRLDGKRIRRKLNCDKNLARRVEKDLLNELITNDVACKSAIYNYEIDQRTSGSSKRQQADRIKKIRNFFKHTHCERLNQVIPSMCIEYIQYRKVYDQIAVTTLNVERQYIKAFFQFCVEMDWIIKNPALRLKPEKDKRELTRKFLSVDELDQLFKLNTKYNTFWSFLLETGIRCTDVFDLKHTDLEGSWVNIFEKKTKKQIRYPINKVAQQIFEGRTDNGSLKVFPEVTKARARQKSVGYIKSILEGANHHTFRHTYAINQLNKGVPKEVLQRLMGHASVKTTEIYANYIDDSNLEKWVLG